MFDWTRRSISFWVAAGMALTVLPLLISAVVVHAWLHGEAIAAFADVATRSREELEPLHRQQIALWEAAIPLEEYVASANPRQIATYRERRVQIERRFQQLDRAFAEDEPLRRTLQRAEGDWSAADRIAGELLAEAGAPTAPRDVAALDRFDGLVGSAVDKLRAVDEEVAHVLDRDHADAVRAYERSNLASVVAGGASLAFILLGVFVIRRVMLANIGRLVDGARRFAAGERAHRINVTVPPELREVADEFNRMIERIRLAEESLASEARHDPLTGLDNRRSFEEAFEAAGTRLRRKNEPFVLLLLDIDHFKRVNDTWGHAAGDQVLRAVAEVLAGSLRGVDRAYRIGGEEFAALLADTSLAGAEVVAERIREAVSAAVVSTDDAEIRVTVSIGLAVAHPSHGLEALLRTADQALYAAKSGGRNRVVAA